MTDETRLATQLPASRLRSVCDPASIDPDQDATPEKPGRHIGQDRAIKAISLAANMPHPNFNVFVMGPPGTGRHDAVDKVLSQHTARQPSPDDWVYVNNFDMPHRPTAMRLPAGVARKFRDEMQDLVSDLAIDVPAMFESDDYQTAQRAINEEFGDQQEQAMADFADAAKAENVAIIRSPMGFMLAAVRDGEVLKAEDFQTLPEPEQEIIEEKIGRLQQDLSDVLSEAPKLDRARRQQIEDLNAKMASQVVSARIDEARDAYRDIEPIQAYLETVRQDMVDNPELFLAAAQQSEDGSFPGNFRKDRDHPIFHRYVVNVMVGVADGQQTGAPFLKEDLPTLDRLTGRIEHVSQMGALITDFTMIKPGALHRANGGCLVLDARRVLAEPMAWAALKQCLQSQSITITSVAERLSLVSTTSLEPDPIPLSVRVVLIGDRLLYMLLVQLDPDFRELFKIEADFEESIDRTPETGNAYAALLTEQAAREGLRPVSTGGTARLLDQAVRLADDSRKFSLHMGALKDLLCEADQYAANAGHDQIEAEDVETAVRQQEHRASRIKDRMREAVRRKTIIIDTDGEQVGQVNGLSVIGLGGYRFGRPSRITARTRMGSGKLVDIEREVELGGPLHSKGVLILGSYLSATYALDVPFSLHASLVFEQSYGGVDGDSASAAELFALISSLSGVPIRQGFAVTGSVNQNGQIQAIGGVNEKIEGFFETCVDSGLTGDQGVVIPSANVEHLMVRQDVCDAVAQGRFHVHAIETIDQGVEMLTGLPAGQRGSDGAFPEGSVNARVEARLIAFAENRLRFARAANQDGGSV